MLKLALNVWITHGSSHGGFSNHSLESRGGEDVSVSVNTNRRRVFVQHSTAHVRSTLRWRDSEDNIWYRKTKQENYFIQRGFSSSSACSTLLLLSGVGGGGRYSRHRQERRRKKGERQGNEGGQHPSSSSVSNKRPSPSFLPRLSKLPPGWRGVSRYSCLSLSVIAQREEHRGQTDRQEWGYLATG